jgi:hypothetical protein
MNLLRYLRIRNPWYCRLEVLAAVALLTHVLVVWAIPYVIMAALSASRPAEERGTGPLLPPMTDATSRRVVMPSPDLLYALCPFDVRQQPLRIQADPHPPGYWSIALYAANSDNFFVLNEHRRRQPLQHRHGLRQADAGVGHRHARLQRLAGHDVLAAFLQVAFDHQPGDAVVARGNLAATSAATVIWRWCCLLLLAWLTSIITCSRRPAALSTAQAASTSAAL